MGINLKQEHFWINGFISKLSQQHINGGILEERLSQDRSNPIWSTIDSIIYFHNHPFPFGAYPLASILATHGFTPSQNP